VGGGSNFQIATISPSHFGGGVWGEADWAKNIDFAVKRL